jgi:hypothetical protein
VSSQQGLSYSPDPWFCPGEEEVDNLDVFYCSRMALSPLHMLETVLVRAYTKFNKQTDWGKGRIEVSQSSRLRPSGKGWQLPWSDCGGFEAEKGSALMTD